jgi:hypothetical protein
LKLKNNEILLGNIKPNLEISQDFGTNDATVALNKENTRRCFSEIEFKTERTLVFHMPYN